MGIVTKYKGFCVVCGRPITETHHLVFGQSLRGLADEDGLVVPLCNVHHAQVHITSATASAFSKIIGQLAWEKHYVAEGGTEEDARNSFRKRYGRSYL